MRNVLLPIFSLFLLVGAGCWAAPIVPTSSVATDWPAYVMSSGDLMLRAPEGWDVRQFDSGGGSVVRVSSPSSEETLTISIGLSRTEGGNVVAYEDWLVDRDIPASTTTVELGGLTMDYRQAVVDGSLAQAVYTSTLPTQPPRYVAVFAPLDASAAMRGVLESVQFSPSQDKQESAAVIP